MAWKWLQLPAPASTWGGGGSICNDRSTRVPGRASQRSAVTEPRRGTQGRRQGLRSTQAPIFCPNTDLSPPFRTQHPSSGTAAPAGAMRQGSRVSLGGGHRPQRLHTHLAAESSTHCANCEAGAALRHACITAAARNAGMFQGSSSPHPDRLVPLGGKFVLGTRRRLCLQECSLWLVCKTFSHLHRKSELGKRGHECRVSVVILVSLVPSTTGYRSVLQFSWSPTHRPLVSDGNSYWTQPCLPRSSLPGPP